MKFREGDQVIARNRIISSIHTMGIVIGIRERYQFYENYHSMRFGYQSYNDDDRYEIDILIVSSFSDTYPYYDSFYNNTITVRPSELEHYSLYLKNSFASRDAQLSTPPSPKFNKCSICFDSLTSKSNKICCDCELVK